MFSLSNLFLMFRRSATSVVRGSVHEKHISSMPSQGRLYEMVRSILFPLKSSSHKGQAGRIGIVGGCEEYTGAPYFAAISALKLGGDLSHVFCTKNAAPVIKSYSPELIVHPLLDSYDAVEEIDNWLARLHCLVVGPGLGRDSIILKNTLGILEKAKARNLPLVIDADGLFLVTEHSDIIKGYKNAILTPNIMEFTRLYEKMFGKKQVNIDALDDVMSLSTSLENVTIVQKGLIDIISDGNKVLVCDGEGSPRRCGGQGDLLSGTMGTFFYWTKSAVEKKTHNDILQAYGPNICAAYAACALTKYCSKLAYEKHRRSTTTTDMIQEIQQAFEQLYE